MCSLREKTRQRCTCVCRLAAISRGFQRLARKQVGVVRIVHDHEPTTIRTVTEPLSNKAQNTSLGILPARDLKLSRNLTISLLKSSCITCVDPEYPCVRIAVSQSVGILNGDLGFPDK
jgi:hypothetical protein